MHILAPYQDSEVFSRQVQNNQYICHTGKRKFDENILFIEANAKM